MFNIIFSTNYGGAQWVQN